MDIPDFEAMLKSGKETGLFSKNESAPYSKELLQPYRLLNVIKHYLNSIFQTEYLKAFTQSIDSSIESIQYLEADLIANTIDHIAPHSTSLKHQMNTLVVQMSRQDIESPEYKENQLRMVYLLKQAQPGIEDKEISQVLNTITLSNLDHLVLLLKSRFAILDSNSPLAIQIQAKIEAIELFRFNFV